MNFKKMVLAAGLALAIPAFANAQGFNVTAKADFVSDYIWRGADQGSGFSIQPTLGLAYDFESAGNLWINAWGSQSLERSLGKKEFDINLGYNIGNFGITLSDYWWEGNEADYGYYNKGHHFEATLAYTISENVPLTFTWSTMFAGADDNNEGDRAYSTYITAAYNFACPLDITLTPAVGFTPWKGMYNAEHAGFTDISLKASRDMKVTENFSIPLFVQAIAAPEFDRTYLVAGFTLGF